jgi:RNase P protein component
MYVARKKSVTAQERDAMTRSPRHWLLRNTKTNFNSRYVVPYYVIIIKYTAINMKYEALHSVFLRQLPVKQNAS